MKEFINRCLDWISNSQIVEKLGGWDFLRGIFIGVIVGIVLLLVLRLLLWIIFRRKASASIQIKSDCGTIEVNTSAITHVIRNAVKSIVSLEIIKIRIYRRGQDLDFVLRAAIDVAGDTAPAIMEKLTGILRQQMKDVFGVENIRDIKLVISSCRKAEQDEPLDFEDDEDVKADASVSDHTFSLKPPMEK
ncbi:MAG: hypothetical protein J6W00_07535 [Lentisphaeria bacterium]|jgi:hypothetical protein|nr:hypothetical protein [Lentisphaeria bacterium]